MNESQIEELFSKPQNLNIEQNIAVNMVHYNLFLLNLWHEILLSSLSPHYFQKANIFVALL